jgi:hypothetical protein
MKWTANYPIVPSNLRRDSLANRSARSDPSNSVDDSPASRDDTFDHMAV